MFNNERVDDLSQISVRQPKIFNHDIMNCTNEQVIGNQYYSGRALGLTEPGDVIQLHTDLFDEWQYITRHYQRVGLSHTDQVVWDVAYEYMSHAYKEFDASVFFLGNDTNEAVCNNEWFSAVDYINSKNNFMALATQLGVAVPLTICFNSKKDILDIEAFPYPCYLKAALSVAGVGIYRCQNQSELLVALDHFDETTPLQVQEEVVTRTFLNLQYEVDDTGLNRLEATVQMLDGFTHMGNRCPVQDAPWHIVEPMAQWLAKEGMRGVFAFDVAVIDEQSGPRYLAIECNPRFNGASYPTGVAHKLGIRQWLAVQLPTSIKSMRYLNLAGLEYSPATKTGIIVVNWGSVLAGKLGVLIAGNPGVQQVFYKGLKKMIL